MSKIPVGISTCLLGKEVRHDGGHKHSRYCTEVLSRYFEFRSLCPELEAGLGVPRPAIHLRESDDGLRLVEVKKGTDHTSEMQGFIDQVMGSLAELRGYILMAKSPSCGMERIRIHNSDGNVVHRDGRGMFAEALIRTYPLMPVEEEGRLNDDQLRENFIERVFAYDDWMQNVAGERLTPQALIEFHTRHKFQLLAHSEQIYRQLGPMLGDLKSEPLTTIADRYIHRFMEAMTKRVSRGSHVNAMQHLMGYLRDSMGDADRKVLMEQVEAYHRGEVPLIVPMTLLRMAQRREPISYLDQQHYLSPYPDDLGLRNRI
ncbi:YbgA family protein [Marinobacter segnicrescens]|uniref:YbgA family protein n=1 Tax=Marinobacter segnicrescens TaxID=430453 RepID=UPI003A93F739